MSIVVKDSQLNPLPVKKQYFKYCYIFDYSKGEIYRVTIPENINNNFQLEEWLEDEYGLRLSQIEYMTTVRKVNIKILDARTFLSKAKSFKQ